MAGRDLQARERAAVADVVASTLRHDLRNKLASIRNASFYLMRQVKKTDLWSADPRVETFFQLIEKELTSAEDVLSKRAPPPTGGTRPRCSARDGVEHALAEAQVPPSVEVVRDLKEQGGVPLEVEDRRCWCAASWTTRWRPCRAAGRSRCARGTRKAACACVWRTPERAGGGGVLARPGALLHHAAPPRRAGAEHRPPDGRAAWLATGPGRWPLWGHLRGNPIHGPGGGGP
ncbi:hypothetical protein QEG98_02795 [Myxococcus sp. MxC21-1]|uniref:hypothetical protein n=1 Tax=Myxococcus sp. MxC21-1 TaxID=3041439 RepID=UPI00292F7F2C|nr:hypothetical protein [Myxococcus sp. MxC21-1]WNZ62764.1 hypothetical protein QEG98_02795 [Myxococcus sp. MxC21-1]